MNRIDPTARTTPLASRSGLHGVRARFRRFVVRTTMGPMGTGTEPPVNVPMTRDHFRPGR